MGWKKLSDHQFTYNEGSLNFTLTGGAFHDDDGDGVPEGVSFENGRPVFLNIKNLKDFHFDVPRGYLVVNGKEYKLLDLDNNAENGEELQLFDENKGFLEGEDRTNPKAYSKVNDHQFTYNEGSLHYTLTGSSFYDNNGDGVPDGVQIIGPKPCFGADGTVFDTSVENFHFKVPSGALMVNGDRYSLAELDNNPTNGYELVIPEKAAVDGWSVVDKPIKGWAYRRGSDNNPINKGSFRLFGDNLVDKNGDGQPDGVNVPTVRIGEMIEGDIRLTDIAITGLSGDVKLNHPQYGLGVFNDDNWDIEIVKHGGDLYQTIYSNISNGATVVISSGTEVINTDGSGKINVLADKPFMLNGKKIDVKGQKYLTLNIKNNEVASMKTEELGWTHKGDNFTFTGRPINDPSQKVKFTVSGKNFDLDKIKMSTFRKVKGLGVSVGIDGLSGEVAVNGKPLGITNDDNYSVHFNLNRDPNIKPENIEQFNTIELLNISPGAHINAPNNWIILDGDGDYYFSNGDYYVATKPAHSKDELQKLSISTVDGKEATVLVKGDEFKFFDEQKVAGAMVDWQGNDLFEDTFKEDFFQFDEFSLLTQSAESIVPEDTTFEDFAAAVSDFIDETFVSEEE